MRKLLLTVYFIVAFVYLHAQLVRDIIIEPDTAGRIITYGSTVNFKFYIVNKKGKQKEVDYNRVDKLITCSSPTAECTATDGRLSFSAKTNNKGFVAGIIKFTS